MVLDSRGGFVIQFGLFAPFRGHDVREDGLYVHHVSAHTTWVSRRWFDGPEFQTKSGYVGLTGLGFIFSVRILSALPCPYVVYTASPTAYLSC